MVAGTRGDTTTAADLSREQLLGLYRQMLEIRRTEEALARLHQAGQIPGACHTYVGRGGDRDRRLRPPARHR